MEEINQILLESFGCDFNVRRVSGYIREGYKVSNDRGYYFSWHKCNEHILFYVRRPALKVREQLGVFPKELSDVCRTATNNSGDRQIWLKNKAQTQRMIKFVLDKSQSL